MIHLLLVSSKHQDLPWREQNPYPGGYQKVYTGTSSSCAIQCIVHDPSSSLNSGPATMNTFSLVHASRYAFPMSIPPKFKLVSCREENCTWHSTDCFIISLSQRTEDLVIQPDSKWDGALDFSLKILLVSNANFTTHIDDQKSISGWSVYLNSALVREKSR